MALAFLSEAPSSARRQLCYLIINILKRNCRDVYTMYEITDGEGATWDGDVEVLIWVWAIARELADDV